MDLASGGFAGLLGSNNPLAAIKGLSIHVACGRPRGALRDRTPVRRGGGHAPINGTAKVASSHPKGGLWRVSFSFHKLTPASRKHFEMVIIDSVLPRFESLR